MGFYDDMVSQAKQTAGTNSGTMSFDDYAEHFRKPHGEDHIALIYTVGTIASGKGRRAGPACRRRQSDGRGSYCKSI